MAKSDLERMGLFQEMGYTTIGDVYQPPGSKPFNASAGKGKQMLIGGTKTKAAVQAGYFTKSFDRIMQGEAYSDPVQLRRQNRLKEAKKNIGGSWAPSNGEKHPSGVGSHYGTFSGPITSFSAAKKPREKYKAPGKNFLTHPGRKGTGYGYVGVTIGPSHKYSSEPFDRARELRKREHTADKKMVKGGPFKLNIHPSDVFDQNPYRSDKPLPPVREPRISKDKPRPFRPSHPAKLTGGCKAGTFEPYPKHSEDPYKARKQKETGSRKTAGVFRPSQGPKSMPTQSVVQQNITRRLNISNFMTASPVS